MHDETMDGGYAVILRGNTSNIHTFYIVTLSLVSSEYTRDTSTKLDQIRFIKRHVRVSTGQRGQSRNKLPRKK
jgi:hypothetical protein